MKTNVPTRTDASQPIAAIDLGSNSFHMIVARPQDAGFHVLDRLREMVRLAGGLDKNDFLSAESMDRGLACLERFGQRLRDIPHANIKAVGTNTLRRAENTAEFLQTAEKALGHPIEIISGLEEARLIYLGVAHGIAEDGQRRLVMDIGGGSTELIVGERFEPLYKESLYMGCVSLSRAYFCDGAITKKRMRNARLAARAELEPLEQLYQRMQWRAAIGASGTIRAIDRVLREMGWSAEGITRPALNQLVDAMLDAGHTNQFRLPGLSERRVPVFPGGVAILLAAVEALGIEHMRVSDSALREGLLYDLLGRIHHEDVRDRTVTALEKRHATDTDHAERVRRTAQYCRARVAKEWLLDDPRSEQLLSWAARLHEIGLAIAHSHYHKHGAYILENADLPGFSQQEQKQLALLVRAHRRKFPAQIFKELADSWGDHLARLAVLLRLAVVLHRSRASDPLPELCVSAASDALKLRFPDGWLGAHPLTETDLKQEARYLKGAGIQLDFG